MKRWVSIFTLLLRSFTSTGFLPALLCAAFAVAWAQPQPSGNLWARGHAAYSSGRYTTAIRDFARVASDRKNDKSMIVDAEIFGGLAAYRLGDTEASRTFWKRASTDYAKFYAEPPSPSRGFAAWMAGRHRDAAKIYEDLVAAGDDNSIGLPATNADAAAPYIASLRELAAGDVATSISSAHAAIARLPGYKSAYFVLGLCDLQRHDRAAARRAFLESLESSGTADPGDFLSDGGFAAFDSIAFLLVLGNEK